MSSYPFLSNTPFLVASPITRLFQYKKFMEIQSCMRNPEKEIFLYVEKTLQATGEQIFFIDDRLENIQAAKERHWQTFHYDLGNDEGKTSNDTLRKILI